jgi:ubiquinone biosynthesis protein
MTRPITHIFRLLKWGRILARHGALRGIEKDRNTPQPVKRLCRIARLGTFQPEKPDYAGAFREIGPAAIKLGQTLATRPDIVGEEATRNLLTLQDSLPPEPFERIYGEIDQSLNKPAAELFEHIDPEPVGAASIAQVHRGRTTDGRDVAIKVLRPGIREQFARDIETYEWAAAHLEALGGEAARLRPALVIANLKRWTLRELDLRREAASASELAEAMVAVDGYRIPNIDWDRTSGRVMTLEWVDGIKISKIEALQAAGHDTNKLAERLVLTFLRQAISEGFFHADMHQGNLFVTSDGTIAAIDFGIMGRINRQARLWLAEILYGLTTGNYRRVAEIHFDAQYVPAHHNVDEFATALRAVGEPTRGKPVSELSVGQMLDSLFAITRDFDMQTQPHLLLLQKTMVMVEGVATSLNPAINMWDVAAPFVREWIRTELGPEAAIADGLRDRAKTLALIPDIIKRLDEQLPRKGGAPPPPPLPQIELIWERQRGGNGWRYICVAVLAAVGGAAGMWAFG